MPAGTHRLPGCARRKCRRYAALLLVLMPGLLAAATGSEFDGPHAQPKVIKVQPHAMSARGRQSQASTRRSRSMIHTTRQRSQVALPIKKNAPRHDSPRLTRHPRAAPPSVATPAVAKTVTPGIPVKPATEAPPVVTTPVKANAPVWLDVEINGQRLGIALLLRDADRHLWARRDQLASWRLPVPNTEPFIDSGEDFYPLAALP